MSEMDTSARIAPFRIGIWPVPGFALMSYAALVEPLRAANLLSGKPLFDLVTFAQAGGAVSSGGAVLPPEAAPGQNLPLDLLVVVAAGDPFAVRDDAAFAWLRRVARQGVRIAGVSGGPVVLARAGLMAGRRMTVHWEHAPLLQEQRPDLLLERRLYVIDRDRMTCGGGTAPLDMMLALIADRHGAGFARQVSDWFLHTEIRAASAPQKAGIAERLATRSAAIVEAAAAMEDHIADPLSLDQVAGFTEVTARQLNRLFTRDLGQSVMEFYRDLRLDAARRLLSGSVLSVTECAMATGFGSSSHLSKAYREKFGHPPREERTAPITK